MNGFGGEYFHLVGEQLSIPPFELSVLQRSSRADLRPIESNRRSVEPQPLVPSGNPRLVLARCDRQHLPRPRDLAQQARWSGVGSNISYCFVAETEAREYGEAGWYVASLSSLMGSTHLPSRILPFRRYYLLCLSYVSRTYAHSWTTLAREQTVRLRWSRCSLNGYVPYPLFHPTDTDCPTLI